MRKFSVTTFLALALLLLMIALPIILTLTIVNREIVNELTVNDLQGIWGITIPASATNIEFVSSLTESTFRLTFDTNPTDALDFAESICGILYPQYNPFGASDTIEFLHHALLIKMNHFTYYSYSPDRDENVIGSRCNPTPGTPIQIHQVVVDTSNSQLYRVRLEQVGRSSQIPSHSSLGINYINPITNFPMMIVGLSETDNNHYFLAHPEICFDTLYTYLDISAWRSEWRYLIGANVQLTIDDESLPLAQISPQGRLVPQNMMGEANSTRNDLFWFYCVRREWEVGSHNIHIRIEPVLNEVINYNIQFEVP
jgi:hypothetical protein